MKIATAFMCSVLSACSSDVPAPGPAAGDAGDLADLADVASTSPLRVLIFGQSNATGMGTEQPAGTPTDRVPYWVRQVAYGYDYDSVGIEPLDMIDPIGEVGPRHGVECAFGLGRQGATAIFKVARGGSFVSQWRRDYAQRNATWPVLSEAASRAVPALSAAVPDADWALVWIQGEAEATESTGGLRHELRRGSCGAFHGNERASWSTLS